MEVGTAYPLKKCVVDATHGGHPGLVTKTENGRPKTENKGAGKPASPQL
ncbi:hypothetical protein SAMN04488090_4870 [Siphonobacter aquaeclarae]|uniref:Uncharacterized protein n=1 Tax=Siphonobacter aquaeclarae TaxID=563176 RepID=A0A1G9YAR5_9BACT|nr:hypothetical protein SAMN04488090_4870 [Siphonobacter aquaeclarae]